MKICPSCKSDVIEKNYSTLWIRIIAAIVLLFIPFGLFLVWIPFIIPYSYICKKCDLKIDEPLEVDWRDFEQMKLELQTKSLEEQDTIVQIKENKNQ